MLEEIFFYYSATYNNYRTIITHRFPKLEKIFVMYVTYNHQSVLLNEAV